MPSKKRQFNIRLDQEAADRADTLLAALRTDQGETFSQADLFALALQALEWKRSGAAPTVVVLPAHQDTAALAAPSAADQHSEAPAPRARKVAPPGSGKLPAGLPGGIRLSDEETTGANGPLARIMGPYNGGKK